MLDMVDQFEIKHLALLFPIIVWQFMCHFWGIADLARVFMWFQQYSITAHFYPLNIFCIDRWLLKRKDRTILRPHAVIGDLLYMLWVT